ncbi:efflux RND transporter periplasmic adaptor subunit [Methylotenera sp. N17]|uniref:efflux RND transporter periplasmic adaptor subunit n=1 Tax=Methylotenera sp. N17 TaxID=1502761 RepID=UPI000647718B|nr:efflux RND transporter periplasmic adaptor subunit [Methylotenera sp. N17]
MRFIHKNKQIVAIFAVIAIGVILAIWILSTEKPKAMDEEHGHTNESMSSAPDTRPQHGAPGHNHEKDHLPLPTSDSVPHDAHEHQAQPHEILKGPHGGKLFTQAGYGLEVTIFEQNVPPEFRIYAYQDGQAIAPEASTVSIELDRLGRKPEVFKFEKENDYLKSNAVVEEPHSFKVNITAQYNNQHYQFAYDQVEARVQVSDKQLTLNSIEVLTAGPASIKSVLNLLGEIKRNADKSVQVVSRASGIVESVNVNAGDNVHKGQVLASVSSQAVADMRSDLFAAQKRMELARTTYIREKQLWEEKVSAQQDYLQAQNDLHEAEITVQRLQQRLVAIGASASSKGLTRYDIRSPIDGVVTNKQISQGQVVSETDSLYEISDLSTVWAEMVIYAKDINTVKVGQTVTIKATAFAAETTGVIAYVSALVGEQSRTAMARVVLNNAGRIWLPGLPVNVVLVSDEVKVPLAVSVEGIQTLRDWSVVFGRYGEYFEARPLVLGRRDDKYVEVLEGIQAGDKYAAGNSFLIKADIGKAGASHDH